MNKQQQRTQGKLVKVISVIAFVINLILISQVVNGQTELQVGVLYEGGEKITVSTLGITFQVPAGWKGALPQGSESFILEPNSGGSSAFILVDNFSDADLRSQLSQNIPLDVFSGLEPSGSVTTKGNLISNRFTTYGLGDFVAYAVGKSGNHGSGFGVVLVAPQQFINQYAAVMDQMVSSAQLKAPQNTASNNTVAGGDVGNGEWSNYMKGRHLRYLKTGNGYSESQHLWLCSDGSFAYSGSDSYMSGGDFSYAGQSGEQYGSWKCSGNKLILSFQDGRVWEYELSADDSALYLDGRQWFRVDNERCQ